ncbi:integrase core domain-containing protein [Sphingobacterium thalpophilum]|uniref:integrase core domain-containing protein n=1 Tax=Sphingobacterium thalpophilum TaxID=259 RepID=UPI002D7963A1|nr:transposase [Sphingobacterium thalpophilum]
MTNDIQFIYIQPSKPMRNGFLERLNGTYRENVVDCYLFNTLDEFREVTWQWMDDYHNHRPHNSPGNMSPTEYAALCDFESDKQAC